MVSHVGFVPTNISLSTMPLCAAINCDNRSGSTPKLGNKLSFYKFPDITKVPQSDYKSTKSL